MSNNNDNSGTMALAFVVAICAFAGMFIYAFAAFLAAQFTLLAFVAWFRPLTLFGETVYPHEARAFVRNGVIGTIMLPVFVAFASALVKFKVSDEIWPHIFIIGYILGSVGVELVKAEEEQKAAKMREINPPADRLPPPSNDSKADPKPFQFAEWEDEE